MADSSSPSLNTTLPSKLDPKSPRARNNAAGMVALLAQIRQQEAAIREGLDDIQHGRVMDVQEYKRTRGM